jgi:predicted ATP-dependent serine protease
MINDIWIDEPTPIRPQTTTNRHETPKKLLIRTGRQTIIDAMNQPEITPLIPGAWNVGEFSILAGDTAAGKSLFAMQESFRIALERKVLYFDFELTDKQFQKRYHNTPMPDNFFHVKFSPATLDFNFGFDDVQNAIDETGADTIVLDNISALSMRSTADADVAISICRGLKELQIKNGTSSLVLAHVPKIPQGTPLNVNHLAGSKHLANFADAITFIGKSCDGESTRYVKNVKNRSGEPPAVYAISISDPGGRLHYQFLGLCEEADHLQPNASDMLKSNAIEKRHDGKSLREIQKELFFEYGGKVSHQTIKNWTDEPVNGAVKHLSRDLTLDT